MNVLPQSIMSCWSCDLMHDWRCLWFPCVGQRPSHLSSRELWDLGPASSSSLGPEKHCSVWRWSQQGKPACTLILIKILTRLYLFCCALSTESCTTKKSSFHISTYAFKVTDCVFFFYRWQYLGRVQVLSQRVFTWWSRAVSLCLNRPSCRACPSPSPWKPGEEQKVTLIFVFTLMTFSLSVSLPDTTPWSWEKTLPNRQTALWATLSACCLSLRRLSWPPRWKQVGWHKTQNSEQHSWLPTQLHKRAGCMLTFKSWWKTIDLSWDTRNQNHGDWTGNLKGTIRRKLLPHNKKKISWEYVIDQYTQPLSSSDSSLHAHSIYFLQEQKEL